MNRKKPLNEGFIKSIQKGSIKSQKLINPKSVQSPPAPKPSKDSSKRGKIMSWLELVAAVEELGEFVIMLQIIRGEIKEEKNDDNADSDTAG